MAKHGCVIFLIALLFVGSQNWGLAADKASIFSYLVSESERDIRYEYDMRLLRLALESTVKTDGPYELVPSPAMNCLRARRCLQTNAIPNLIVKLSYNPDYQQRDMVFAPFPVDLGYYGYRVCLGHQEVIDRLSRVSTVEELRRFTLGQEVGWSDNRILQYNGFAVTEVPHYAGLFDMVANRRFDLCCRGANELLGELKAHRHLHDLSLDRVVALSYPCPRFFYAHATNREGLDRIHRGLVIAYENGALQELWREFYGESVNFVELRRRKVFTLKNPLIEGLPEEYRRYIHDPFN